MTWTKHDYDDIPGRSTRHFGAGRRALQSNLKMIHKHYHVPISNTGAGVLVLENYG